jgi:hypothetical protein
LQQQGRLAQQSEARQVHRQRPQYTLSQPDPQNQARLTPVRQGGEQQRLLAEDAQELRQQGAGPVGVAVEQGSFKPEG